MEETLIPLFPLEVVLFPEAPLPLHIFEPRYKTMIGECLKSKSPFGVVLARNDSIGRIGCSAQVVNITRKYEDGRMDIFTVGRQRFEILFTNEERPFLQAGVYFFEDEKGEIFLRNRTPSGPSTFSLVRCGEFGNPKTSLSIFPRLITISPSASRPLCRWNSISSRNSWRPVPNRSVWSA